MNNGFAQKDILKKHESNIKSAASSFTLAGILGIIYIVRYLVKNTFDFYFSLSFTELMLRLSDSGRLSEVVAFSLVALYVAGFLAISFLAAKNAKNLLYSLIFYSFDCICLIPLALFHGQSITPDFFIDVIVHLFVVLFIIVGIRSHKKLQTA